MKKTMAFLLSLGIAIGLLAACGKTQPQTQSTQSGAPQTQQSQPVQPSQAVTPPAVNTANFIGEDQAKNIALAQAGLTADAVFFELVELDFENGVWQYEIEFNNGRTEYDVDIKAEDGSILKWDVDID